MLITLEEYGRLLRRSFFRDCAVRSRNIFVFMRERSYTDEEVEEEERMGYNPSLRPKGVIAFFRDMPKYQPGNQWFVGPLQGWETTLIGAAQKPRNQSISIEQTAVFPSLDHRVYVSGSGPAHEDRPITSLSADPNARRAGAFKRGATTRLKTLDGWLYVCGGGRSFAKRLDDGTWQSFTQDIPTIPPEERIDYGQEGFEDFDGWGERDIYAVGGYGDVWHFDGERWRQIPFPSNEPLQSVCCGADGNVYISGYEGVTFMGRSDRWKKIHGGGISLGFRDMVWYEDRVWCTSDYGLSTIHDGRVRRVDVPAEVSACAGHLAVGDGVLLLAGLGGAAFKENGQWQQILSFSAMERILQLDEQDRNP